MLLLVHDRVPPEIHNAVGPDTAAHEEGAEVEAPAVLGYDQVDGGRGVVAGEGAGGVIEVGGVEGVRDVERVVEVDVAVGVGLEGVEDVRLERVAGFHDEGVEVKPPEPELFQYGFVQAK